MSNLKRIAATAVAVAASITMFGGSVLAKTDLLVYTAVEADELKMFKDAFEKDYPDVNIKWVRDSTGIVTAKLLAEKSNPQADIVWGLSATSLLFLAKEGYFQPYAPKGLDKLDKRYYDAKNSPPLWVGQRAYIAAVCYNTVEGKKHNIPQPKTWQDLTKAAYKGHVIMPNPSSSGTGFLDVSAWLQMWGTEKGWAYMDGLHANIARYTHSGSAPCKMAAAGEIPVGISFDYRAAKSKTDGAPIEVIVPDEGVGWDLESFGIVKGAKHLKEAQALADWSVTRTANEIYSKQYAVVAMPGVAKPVTNLPPAAVDKMIKNDFLWAAANRDAILSEWQKRYDSKSEPKKK
jgi:iron(III) transport system substrate-binding protein